MGHSHGTLNKALCRKGQALKGTRAFGFGSDLSGKGAGSGGGVATGSLRRLIGSLGVALHTQDATIQRVAAVLIRFDGEGASAVLRKATQHGINTFILEALAKVMQ